MDNRIGVNENVLRFLDLYMEMPDPRFGVLLKGGWGCGKTHFIKNWLASRFSDKTASDASEVVLRPIYISVYGMSKVSDVREAIIRELNPFLYSKAGSIIKGALNLIGKFAVKTDLSMSDNDSASCSMTTTLDPLSLLGVKDTTVKGDRILIFDDIERSHIDVKSLLGFINYFIEHCGCHVIIIGDISKISEDEQNILFSFKEKSIGREFQLHADLDAAMSCFLDEFASVNACSWLHDALTSSFRCSGSENLRLLRQGLLELNEILQRIDTNLINKDNRFLFRFVCIFLIVFLECNNPKFHDFLYEACKNPYLLSVANQAELYSELTSKYSALGPEIYNNITGRIWLQNILYYISGDSDIIEFANSIVDEKQMSSKPWLKLRDFMNMEQSLVEDLCRGCISGIKSREITDFNAIGFILGYLLYFRQLKISAFQAQDESDILDTVSGLISGLTDRESLYLARKAFIAGLDNVNTLGVKVDEFISTSDCINRMIDEASASVPDRMESTLINLDDYNVESLFSLDEERAPGRDTNYQLSPIFKNIDADGLFDNLRRMSNRGRNRFCDFIIRHYKFDYSIVGVGKYYHDDIDCILRLKNLTVQHVNTLHDGVDKLSYSRLSDILSKALTRCRSENTI